MVLVFVLILFIDVLCKQMCCTLCSYKFDVSFEIVSYCCLLRYSKYVLHKAIQFISQIFRKPYSILSFFSLSMIIFWKAYLINYKLVLNSSMINISDRHILNYLLFLYSILAYSFLRAILYGDESKRVQSRSSIELVDLFLTPLNVTEFSDRSTLNSLKSCLYRMTLRRMMSGGGMKYVIRFLTL